MVYTGHCVTRDCRCRCSRCIAWQRSGWPGQMRARDARWAAFVKRLTSTCRCQPDIRLALAPRVPLTPAVDLDETAIDERSECRAGAVVDGGGLLDRRVQP